MYVRMCVCECVYWLFDDSTSTARKLSSKTNIFSFPLDHVLCVCVCCYQVVLQHIGQGTFGADNLVKKERFTFSHFADARFQVVARCWLSMSVNGSVSLYVCVYLCECVCECV